MPTDPLANVKFDSLPNLTSVRNAPKASTSTLNQISPITGMEDTKSRSTKPSGQEQEKEQQENLLPELTSVRGGIGRNQLSFKPQEEDYSKNRLLGFEYDSGVNSTTQYLYGEEIARKSRAELQGGGAQSINAVGRVLSKVIPGIIGLTSSGIQTLLETKQQIGNELFIGGGKLLGVMTPEMEKSIREDPNQMPTNPYTNFVSKWAEETSANMDELAPIHRIDPNAVFDIHDSAHWLSNGSSLVESVAEFLAFGQGVGKLTGTAALKIAQYAGFGIRGTTAMRALSQTATAGFMAYAEGVTVGAQVYDQTFQEALEKTDADGNLVNDEQSAHKIAAEAAAHSVQINTAINTLLNITMAGKFVGTFGLSKALPKSLQRKAGESLLKYKARLATTPELAGSFWGKLGLETSQESLEEVVNELAQVLGERKGRELNESLGYMDKKMGVAGKIFETMTKSSTGFAALLGAVGGAGMHTVIYNTKGQRNQRKKEAEFQQSQVNHLIEKIENVETANTEILDAEAKGDKIAYEMAVNKLFSIQSASSFFNGTSEGLSSVYASIAEMTPEQAEAAGYNTEEGDNNYRTKAKQAIKDIKVLSKTYEDTIHRYNSFDENARDTQYGERVFLMQMHKYNLEKNITHLSNLEREAANTSSENLKKRGITDFTIQQALEAQRAQRSALDALQKENDEIQKINDLDTRTWAGQQTLLTAYGQPAEGVSLKQHALNQLLERNTTLLKLAEDGAARIENAKKEFLLQGHDIKDFNDALNANNHDKELLANIGSTILSEREALKQHDKEYSKFTSKEGKEKYIKETKEKLNSQVQERKKEEEERKRKEKEAAEQRKKDAIVEKQRLRDEAERLKQERIAAEAEAKRLAAEQALLNPVPINPVVEGPPPAPEGYNIVDPVKTDAEIAQELAEKEIAEKERLRLEQEQKEDELKDGEVISPTPTVLEDAVELEIDESLSTSDMLVISAANSIAYLSKPYEEKDGKKVTMTNEKNPDHVLELESPTVFKYGTTLTLEVDKSAAWVDEKGIPRKYDDFVNPQTGEVDVNNVPIAIKDENGRTVGYLRTNTWIEKPYGPGYANVANDTDPESPLYENAKKQAARNIKIRNFVLEASKRNESVKTTVTQKSAGVLSRNMENGEKTSGTMASLTPGLNTITVVKKGQFHSGTNEVHSPDGSLLNTVQFLETLSSKNGIVFIPVPSPNGNTLMVPALIPKVSENQADTIMHALEMFLSPGDPRAQFQEGDVFDLTSAEGVFDLISGITHIVSDSAASFEERVNAPGNAKAVHLSLDKKTGIISIAKHDKQVLQIQTVEDLQANKDAVKQLLMEKLFSVKLSMINKSDTTYEAVYNPETQSIDTVPHNNYNDHVKQHLRVDIIETPIGNGENSYFDQPVIQFSTDFLREAPPAEVEKEVEEDEFVNLIDKLESLVEKFKAEGQTEQEAKVSAFNELNETEKTELLGINPEQQTTIEAKKAEIERRRQEVREAIQKAGQGEGGQFIVTLLDGTKENAVRISLVGNELGVGNEGSMVDLSAIKKVENPDGTIVYDAELPGEIENDDQLAEGGAQIDEVFLTNAMVEFLDDKTKEPCTPLAKDGARPSKFTKGSQWEVVKDLKGYPSHKDGGVDLSIGKNGVSFKNSKGVLIKAKNGLVLGSLLTPGGPGSGVLLPGAKPVTKQPVAKPNYQKPQLYKAPASSTSVKQPTIVKDQWVPYKGAPIQQVIDKKYAEMGTPSSMNDIPEFSYSELQEIKSKGLSSQLTRKGYGIQKGKRMQEEFEKQNPNYREAVQATTGAISLIAGRHPIGMAASAINALASFTKPNATGYDYLDGTLSVGLPLAGRYLKPGKTKAGVKILDKTLDVKDIATPFVKNLPPLTIPKKKPTLIAVKAPIKKKPK